MRDGRCIRQTDYPVLVFYHATAMQRNSNALTVKEGSLNKSKESNR